MGNSISDACDFFCFCINSHSSLHFSPIYLYFPISYKIIRNWLYSVTERLFDKREAASDKSRKKKKAESFAERKYVLRQQGQPDENTSVRS